MELYQTDPKKLEEEDAAVKAERERLRFAGGISDNLANRKSFGEFFLEKFGPKQDTGAYFEEQAKGIADPAEKRKKMLEALKASREGKLDENENDPTSEISKQYREFARTELRMQTPDNATAAGLARVGGPMKEFMQSRFKAEQDRKTEIAKAGAKRRSEGLTASLSPGEKKADEEFGK